MKLVFNKSDVRYTYGSRASELKEGSLANNNLRALVSE